MADHSGITIKTKERKTSQTQLTFSPMFCFSFAFLPEILTQGMLLFPFIMGILSTDLSGKTFTEIILIQWFQSSWQMKISHSIPFYSQDPHLRNYYKYSINYNTVLIIVFFWRILNEIRHKKLNIVLNNSHNWSIP